MTTIVHCQKQHYDVYIGRPRKGAAWRFGNPFEIPRDGDRETVIHKFEVWLNSGEAFGNPQATLDRRNWILQNLKQLKNKSLGCFCAPLPCHGDVLKEYADRI